MIRIKIQPSRELQWFAFDCSVTKTASESFCQGPIGGR
jgi:hypothetical protein